MPSTDRPLFSVIIPTRDRASLFAIAFGSVLEQRFDNFELIVVNDGSSADQASLYREVMDSAPANARMLALIRTQRGHGQAYALNVGVSGARGDYLCFLDDDDQWIDQEHLGRAATVIAANTEQHVDMILAN